MWSTDGLLPVFLVTGFTVGYGHCIGMCGPLVVALSLNLKGRSIWLPHGLYNLGRVITYTLMGGIFGFSGSFAVVAARISAIQKGALIFSGILIFALGMQMAGLLPMNRIFKAEFTPGGKIHGIFKKLSTSKNPWTYFPLGMALGLLPCGPVYTALIAAAGTGVKTGDPLSGLVSGAALMAVFGLGTIPALLTVARLSSVKWLFSRQTVYRVGGFIMGAVGLYFIVRGALY